MRFFAFESCVGDMLKFMQRVKGLQLGTRLFIPFRYYPDVGIFGGIFFGGGVWRVIDVMFGALPARLLFRICICLCLRPRLQTPITGTHKR